MFAAYTGLRAEEIAGCEVGDVVFTAAPAGVRAHIDVRRAKKRRGGSWVTDTLKSTKSRRTVPLPGWLAERMREYLDTTRPAPMSRRAVVAEPCARRRATPGCRAVAPLDFSEPVDIGAFYKNLLRPALEAVGLPASRPGTTLEDGTPVPAIRGIRLHDLRHTFATLQLSAGVHFMQVSKWLGHSTFTLTLDVYGDYIPEEDGGVVNALPEPPAPAKQAELPDNVVQLFGRKAN